MIQSESLPSACRLCGSTLLRERGTKQGRFRDLTFHFFECRVCTFLFVSPIVGPDIYDDRYYRGDGPDPLVDYDSEYTNYAATPRVYEFLDLNRLASQHVQNGLPDPGEPLRWLDYGCGAGGLLKFLRDRKTLSTKTGERAIEASGYDVGSYADKLSVADRLTIWTWDELQALPSGYFQIISCIEVIEHLPEPLTVLELLSRLLAPGGLLLLSTGNLRSPLARVLGIAFPYCVPEIHISYFSPASLRFIYGKVGLTPVNVRFHGALRFKFLKSIAPLLPARFAQLLSRLIPLLFALDLAYGVSAMPSATKEPA